MIQNDLEYQATLARIDELWDTAIVIGTPESDELDRLISDVEAYEAKDWPQDEEVTHGT